MIAFVEFSEVNAGRWAVALTEIVSVTEHKTNKGQCHIAYKAGTGLASKLVEHSYSEILAAINEEDSDGHTKEAS